MRATKANLQGQPPSPSKERPSAFRHKSLVLVVGAGASKEVNLPVGEELKQAISSALNFGSHLNGGDQKILHAFYQLAQESGKQTDILPYIQASDLIRNAMPQAQSIDDFIDSRRSDSMIGQCGKLAIASCILAAERASSLRVDRSNVYNTIKFKGVSGTWFTGLFKLINAGCHRDELTDRLKRVAIVSFNYDRCLEHFLHGSLRNYYSLSSDEATATIRSIDIFHPYGTVGPLPWIAPSTSTGVEYGGEAHAQELVNLATKIRTFTEGTDEKDSDIAAIRSCLKGAERVAFLGFAFHSINLKLLYGPKRKQASNHYGRVYATAMGLSESDARVIANDLSFQGGYLPENISVHKDLTAHQLLKDYSRSLSLQ